MRHCLKGEPAAFAGAAAAHAARVEAEGDAAVVGYRFWAGGTEVRAVADHASPEVWVRHHDIAMPRTEMTASHAAADLVETTFLGAVAPGIRARAEDTPLAPALGDGLAPVAGFRR